MPILKSRSNQVARWSFALGVMLAALMLLATAARSQVPAGTETAEITLNATGVWYVQVRARSVSGLRSGPSNVVASNCTALPCVRVFLWDSNPAGTTDDDTVANYVLEWGKTLGNPAFALTVMPQSTPVPGQLPRPSLRIRRPE
jgi:hypothetical protein